MAQKEITEHFFRYPGKTKSELRKNIEAIAARANGGVRPEAKLPERLQKFVTKVATEAYKITDKDFDEQKETYSEEELYEILIATTLGAANARFEKAEALLKEPS